MSDRPDGSPTAVDVVLRPEWATEEARDKTILGYALNKVFGGSENTDYLVPAGKTLYIVEVSAWSHADNAADAELQQMCLGSIYDVGGAGIVFSEGGNGGFGMSLSKKLVIPGGNICRVNIANMSNHVSTLFMMASGYEV